MKVRICQKCGEQNKEDSWSCVKCGETLSMDTIKGIDEVQVELNIEDSLPPKSSEAEMAKLNPELTPISEHTQTHASHIKTRNERITFAFSGMRTGLVLSLVTWLIARSDIFTFLANLFALLIIGALYGGISKKGGVGAKNGAIIGVLYGTISMLFIITILMSEGINVFNRIGTIVSGPLMLGVLGLIIGAIFKWFFGEDDKEIVSGLSANSSNKMDIGKANSVPPTKSIESKKIYQQKVLKAKGRCIICGEKLGIVDRFKGESYCLQHKAT